MHSLAPSAPPRRFLAALCLLLLCRATTREGGTGIAAPRAKLFRSYAVALRPGTDFATLTVTTHRFDPLLGSDVQIAHRFLAITGHPVVSL